MDWFKIVSEGGTFLPPRLDEGVKERTFVRCVVLATEAEVPFSNIDYPVVSNNNDNEEMVPTAVNATTVSDDVSRVADNISPINIEYSSSDSAVQPESGTEMVVTRSCSTYLRGKEEVEHSTPQHHT